MTSQTERFGLLVRPAGHGVALLALAPFVALLTLAISGAPASEWSLAPMLLRGVGRSLVYGLATASLACLLGGCLAYALSFFDFPARRLWGRMLVLPLLLPTFVVAAIYRELFAASGPLAGVAPGLLPIEIASGAGFVGCAALTLYPWAFLFFRVTFEHHGAGLLEVGATSGLGPWQVARAILLPLATPALVLGGLLVFLETVSDIATPELLSLPTGAVWLKELWINLGHPRLAAAFGGMALGVALVVAMVGQRFLAPARLRHLLLPSVRDRVARRPLAGWRAAGAVAVCGLPVLAGFVIPMLYVAAAFVATLAEVDLLPVLGSAAHSVALVICVVGLCTLLTALLSFTLHAHPNPFTRFVIRLLSLSYLLPAVTLVFAVSALVTFSLPWIERFSTATSFLLLVAALSLRLVCFLLVPTSLGLGYLPRRLDDLAASLGIDRTGAFFRLHLPRARRFVWLGLLLVTLQALRATSISLVLRPFGLEPITLEIFNAITIDLLAPSAGWILALVLLGLYPLLTIEGLLSRGWLAGG